MHKRYVSKNLEKWVHNAEKLVPGMITNAISGGEEKTGFLIINAGCNSISPYKVKQALTGAGCIGSTTGKVLYFQTDIPFILVDAPLLSSAKCTAMPVEREAVTFTVTLLPVAQEKNSGTSNQGCPYLAMVPCNTRYVMEHTQVPFQKDVIGQDLFFSSNQTTSSGVSGPGPRTIVSEPIREVPGLYWVADFVTQEEHDRILSHFRGSIDNGTLTPEQLARRTVLHFNRRFIYGVNQLGAVGEDVNENPPFYTWMRDRLQNTDAGVEIVGEYPFEKGTFTCDQLTVNLYDYSKSRVSGIAPHVDAHAPFEDCILIVSLGSGTVMDFSHENDAQFKTTAPYGVYMAPRSLVIISGEARYNWMHCIAERKTDILSEFVPKLERGYRVSLTWRKGRTTAHKKSTCPYPLLCDGEEG